MLASTVQFSNNDQTPVTPHPHREEDTGAGTEDKTITAVPSGPNNVPDTIPIPSLAFHAPKRSTSSDR